MQAMVVDDSRAMRAMLGRYLRGLGFDVLEAGDGDEALAQLRDHVQPSFVLVDWNMPVMDGLSFVREVRSSGDWPELPLMMVTTETELAQMATALEAGANEYLMKPFSRDALVEKLDILGIQHQ